MAKKPSSASSSSSGSSGDNGPRVSTPVDELLTQALERGDDTLETGRFIVTYKESAAEQGVRSLRDDGFRVADARDYTNQAVALEAVGDADALVFPEIGSAVISGGAFRERGMSLQMEIAEDSPIEVVEPEYFAFANAGGRDLYLRGFRRAAQAIEEDLAASDEQELQAEEV